MEFICINEHINVQQSQHTTPKKWLYVAVVLTTADTAGAAIGCHKQTIHLHCNIRLQDKVKPT